MQSFESDGWRKDDFLDAFAFVVKTDIGGHLVLALDAVGGAKFLNLHFLAIGVVCTRQFEFLLLFRKPADDFVDRHRRVGLSECYNRARTKNEQSKSESLG